jgi:enoyl-CoA hydratase/carnithine racemase
MAVATLNRPRTINALSQTMIDTLTPALQDWAGDEAIKVVVLRGAGERGFCAGGDVVALYQAMRAGELAVADRFFTTEYRLDHMLHTYPKPVLCLGDGFVMGGGMGLFMAASHRLVTERSTLAMPEIQIGLYPDVGMSHALATLPHGMGRYMALTGASLNARDAIALGMVHGSYPGSAAEVVLDQLAQAPWDQKDPHGAMAWLTEHLPPTQLPPPRYASCLETIASLMAGDDLLAVASGLQMAAGEGSVPAADWQRLQAGCPMTAHLGWEMQRRCAQASWAETFRTEWLASTQCARRKDFPEGVRAMLVDKDKNPRWQHAALDQVSREEVLAHLHLPAGHTHNPLEDLA